MGRNKTNFEKTGIYRKQATSGDPQLLGAYTSCIDRLSGTKRTKATPLDPDSLFHPLSLFANNSWVQLIIPLGIKAVEELDEAAIAGTQCFIVSNQNLMPINF